MVVLVTGEGQRPIAMQGNQFLRSEARQAEKRKWIPMLNKTIWGEPWGRHVVPQCHDTTKTLSLISILVDLILSWTPRGTTRLPRGTAQIALLSIGIYFLFSAFFVSDRRNWLPHITIGLRP